MSKGLLDVISQFLLENGQVGKSNLCAAVGRSERTLERWIHDGIPDPHYGYLLARQCGCSKEEALALAKECSSSGARTA